MIKLMLTNDNFLQIVNFESCAYKLTFESDYFNEDASEYCGYKLYGKKTIYIKAPFDSFDQLLFDDSIHQEFLMNLDTQNIRSFQNFIKHSLASLDSKYEIVDEGADFITIKINELTYKLTEEIHRQYLRLNKITTEIDTKVSDDEENSILITPTEYDTKTLKRIKERRINEVINQYQKRTQLNYEKVSRENDIEIEKQKNKLIRSTIIISSLILIPCILFIVVFNFIVPSVIGIMYLLSFLCVQIKEFKSIVERKRVKNITDQFEKSKFPKQKSIQMNYLNDLENNL